MGFNQIRTVAFYYRIGLLILIMISLMVCYESFSRLTSPRTSSLTTSISSHESLPTLDAWMLIVKSFHLQVIAYRPFGKNGVQIGLQGLYQDLIACLEYVYQKHPTWQWSRILIEEKQGILRMQWELQR